MRDMLAEHRLHPSDFILPMFICEGSGCEEPIESLRGVSRWSVDRIAERAKDAAKLGIPCVALFLWLNAALIRSFAERAASKGTREVVGGSHALSGSRPDEVAATILDAVASL